MSRVQLVEVSNECKQALACTEAEESLAAALADEVFLPANDGVRPTVYLELAAIILARTAHHAIAHHNRTESPQIGERGTALVLSYMFNRASQLIAEKPGSATAGA